MMTAQFFSGASLFALLIVHTCCYPAKKGNNPTASYGGSYPNAASYGGSYPNAASYGGSYPNAAPADVSMPSYEPELEMSRPQPARRPAAVPVGFRQPGATFQPARREFAWAVQPPTLGEEMSASSSRPENVSPPLPPPSGPTYQAGELSHYAQNLESGDYESESEEQGYMGPPPSLPMEASTGSEFTSPPRPDSGSLGSYPYYDYMLVMGAYPPGTYTHSSISYEQGRDGWEENHYERYDYPAYNPGPVQEPETFTHFAAPSQPVKAPHAWGRAQPQLSAPYGSKRM